jgi:hypothetical protein
MIVSLSPPNTESEPTSTPTQKRSSLDTSPHSARARITAVIAPSFFDMVFEVSEIVF